MITLIHLDFTNKKVAIHKFITYSLQIFFFTCLFFGVVISAYAQNDLKNWNSLQLDLSLSKKLDVRFSHLRSYNISNNYNNEFNQFSAHIDYDFTKRFSLSGGVTAGSFSDADGADRLVVRSTFKTPVADVLTWSNSIQGEVHSSKETRYRYRVVYITRLATKKRLKFLRLSPSVSYSLYYNIGGNPIQYYDKDDDPVVQQTPDGFHRGRLFVNLNSKISKYLSVSLYYMMQREVNLFSSEYHKMNIVNPNTSNIVRPFQDYNVIGTSILLNFDLYKKKQKIKKSTKESDQ